MSRWATCLVGAVLAALSLMGQARAQSGASCPIGPPKIVAGASYTLTNNDECAALIFTSTSPVSVTAPAASTVAPGFQALLFSVYSGLTVTPALPSQVSNQTSAVLGAGQSALFYGDGANYWWGNGAGFLMGAAQQPGIATALGQTPGTTISNSPVIQMPNGIMRLTNTASIIPSANGDILKICGGNSAALGVNVSGRNSAWWEILDPFNTPYKIPLCR